MDELETMRESARLWRERAKRLERENQWLREKLDGRAEAKRALREEVASKAANAAERGEG